MAVELAAEQIRVAFAGGDSREGPLTLGQRNVLQWMRDQPPDSQDLMLPVTVPVPAGTPVRAVTAAVAELVRRHESLRTVLTDPEGTDVRQRVAGAGELVMPRYEAGAAPDELLPDVVAGLAGKAVDPAAELPIRAAVVTSHGAPSHAVLAFSHLAVDAASADLLRRQFARLLDGAGTAYVPGRQPIDQAVIESTEAARSRHARAVDYWQARASRAPQAMFAVPVCESGRAAYRAVRLRSRAVALAASAVAARTRTGRSTAVLAAVSAVVGHYTGQDDCVVVAVAGNRQTPELRGYVGPLAQDALVTFGLTRVPFDSFVRRVWAASLNGYRHSQFDAVRLWRALDEVGDARGTKFARDFVFNDLSAFAPGTAAQAREVRPDEIAAAVADTELAWLPAAPLPVRFVCYVNRLDPGHAELVVWADVRRIAADRLAAAVRGVERLLVEAATRPVDLAEVGAISGLDPVSRGAGWHRIDSCWVELAQARRLVAEALPAYQSGVFFAGDSLVAYVAGGGRPVTPRDAHRACVAALPGRDGAMAAHRYVICDGAPAELSPPFVRDCGAPLRCTPRAHIEDVAAWRALPVLAEGTGRSGA